MDLSHSRADEIFNLQESLYRFVARLCSDELAVRLCFAVLAVITVAVKVSRLSSRELWLDETYSSLLARMPFKQALRYAIGDVHPPLFYVLLWQWVRAVGDSEAALRLFSVSLSAVGTIGFFLLVRKWLGTRPAAFGSLLFALSPMLYVYSLEVRMYMLAVCCVIGILSIHRIVTSETNGSWLYLVLYSLLSALLYYTHYIGLFVLMGFFIDWIVATRCRSDRLLHLFFAALLTFVLTAPWIPIMFTQRAQKLGQGHALIVSYQDPTALTFGESPAETTIRDYFLTYVRNAGAAIGLYPARSVILLICLALPIILVLAGAVFLAATGDRVCRLLVFVTLAMIAGFVVLGAHETRYFLPLLPFMFLSMSRTLQVWRGSRWRSIATIIAALVLVIYTAGFIRQVTMRHPRPWSSLVAALEHNYRQNDVVVFDVLYGQVMFDYYAKQAGFHPREVGFPESIYAWWEQQPFKGWGGPVLTKSDLDSTATALEKLPHPKTVWLVLDEVNYYDPRNALLARMAGMGNPIEFETSYVTYTFPQNTSGEHPRLMAISAR
jgi:uncharacterized membrane protein